MASEFPGPKILPTGGVNLLDDPASIRDDQVLYCKNLIPIKPGVLGTRPALMPPEIFDSAGFAIYRYDSGFRVPRDILISSLGVFVLNATGSLSDLSFLSETGGGAVLTVGLVQHRGSLFAFNNKVYLFQGVGDRQQGWVAFQETGPDFSLGEDVRFAGMRLKAFAFSGTGNGAVQPSLAVPYRRRIVYLNLGKDLETSVLFSDADNPALIGDSATSNRAFQIGTREDGVITGAVEIMLTSIGSPAQGALLVFTETAAFMLTGEPAQTTDVGAPPVGDLNVSRVSFNCGCSSPATIVTTPYGTIWVGPDNVWMFQQGQVPFPIGNLIQPVLANTPSELRYRWHAAYYDGFYRLAVFSEGQGASDLSPCREQWWLDLRHGPPRSYEDAKWYGPQIFVNWVEGTDGAQGSIAGTQVMTNLKQSGNEYLLMWTRDPANGAVTYAGVLQKSLGALSARDLITPVATTLNYQATGNEIEIDLRTKQYEDDEGLEDAIYDSIDLSIQVSEPSRIYIDAKMDAGTSTDTNSKEVAAYGPAASIDAENTTLLTERYAKLTIPASNPASPPLGSRHEYRIYSKAGYFVTADTDTFRFTYNGVAKVATLTQGFYSDLTTYMAELIRAMEAVTSIGLWDYSMLGRTAATRPQLVAIGPVTGLPWSFSTTDAETRQILALLGYVGTEVADGGQYYTATETVPWKRSAVVRLRGMKANVVPIPRRPD